MPGNEKLCSSQEWLTNGVRAVFSDETEQFRAPFEPVCGDEVRIKIRVWKNSVDKAEIVWNDQHLDMECLKEEGLFGYYIQKISVTEEPISYYFCLWRGSEVFYYNKYGLADELQPEGNFKIFPGFSTPKWARGAVMYQIFTDRFYNGDKSNDVQDREYFYEGDYSRRTENWNKVPDTDAIHEFYGGDLQGILDKLDYLQDLGVEVIYLNPIFASPSNHKYDTQDYENIDPHFGRIVNDCTEKLKDTDHENRHAYQYIRRVADQENLEASNQMLAQLSTELHKRGMRLILDGVFNHCGSFNKWLDREGIYAGQADFSTGAYEDKLSPYRDYFHFEKDKWPKNDSYESWWGFPTLPKLNFEGSKDLESHILEIGKKWISEPYNVDGWRLDVAADLGHSKEYNHSFWRKFRQTVKGVNPEAVILAEHYGDPADWLMGDQWDTVMNYDAFMEPVTWFLTGMEKHSDGYEPELEGCGEAFVQMMTKNMAKFTGPSLQCAMNELSNHDHSRFLTRTNHKIGRIAELGAEAASENIDKGMMRLAVLMQLTLPGAPTLYYGDEAGQVGFTDPDNRRTFPWGQEDWELIQFHKDLIRIHKKEHALRYGSFKFLDYGQDYLAYGRFDRDSQILIVLNRKEETIETAVSVWELGVPETAKEMELIFTSKPKGHSVAKDVMPIINGQVYLEIPAKTGLILKR